MTDTAPTLNRDDVAALRKAEQVTFHHYKGESFIHAHVRQPSHDGRQNVWTASEQRLFPVLDPYAANERHRAIGTDVSMGGYTGDGSGYWSLAENQDASAFYMAYHVPDSLATVFGLLRTGDTLTMAWIASNNNEISREIGWHRDELRLLVTRGKTTMTFLVDVQVGPDNSARMISRFGR